MIDELETGIAVGIAIGAGLAGECSHFTGRQVAVMLDSMASQPQVAAAVAAAFRRHAALDRELAPSDFRDAIAEAVGALAKAKRGR